MIVHVYWQIIAWVWLLYSAEGVSILVIWQSLSSSDLSTYVHGTVYWHDVRRASGVDDWLHYRGSWERLGLRDGNGRVRMKLGDWYCGHGDGRLRSGQRRLWLWYWRLRLWDWRLDDGRLNYGSSRLDDWGNRGWRLWDWRREKLNGNRWHNLALVSRKFDIWAILSVIDFDFFNLLNLFYLRNIQFLRNNLDRLLWDLLAAIRLP